MAEFEVTLDEQRKIVHAKVCGELSRSQGMKLVAKARTLAAQSGLGILWDVRQARLQVQLADFFYLPREVEELKTFPTRKVRVGLVIPPEAFEEYQFYENVATNVGLVVKVFLEEAPAITWLNASEQDFCDSSLAPNPIQSS